MDLDTQLQQAVVTELASDPEIEPDIVIKVLHGNVTLSGNIGSYAGWCKAVRAAERVAGVGWVSVDLAATFPSASQRSEMRILKLLEEVLIGIAPRRRPEGLASSTRDTEPAAP